MPGSRLAQFSHGIGQVINLGGQVSLQIGDEKGSQSHIQSLID
jgi:hypothetical protein